MALSSIQKSRACNPDKRSIRSIVVACPYRDGQFALVARRIYLILAIAWRHSLGELLIVRIFTSKHRQRYAELVTAQSILPGVEDYIAQAKRAGLFCVAVPNSLTGRLSLEQADLRLTSLVDLPLKKLVLEVQRNG